MGGIGRFHERFGRCSSRRCARPARTATAARSASTAATCGWTARRTRADHRARARRTRRGRHRAAAAGRGGHDPAPARATCAASREPTRQAGALLIARRGGGRVRALRRPCSRASSEGVAPDFLCLGQGDHRRLPAAGRHPRHRAGLRGVPRAARGGARPSSTATPTPATRWRAAAALATLDIFERENVLDGLPGEGASTSARRSGASRTCPAVGRRAAATASPPGSNWSPTGGRSGATRPASGAGCASAAPRASKGVFLRPLGDVIVLMPPLSITEGEIDLLVAAVSHGIRTECGDATA